jgi:hypothetical protein
LLGQTPNKLKPQTALLFLLAYIGCEGLVALDDYLRNQLSKSLIKKLQRRWASIDGVALRWMTCYIFSLVRTQGGKQGGRYHAIELLKSLVATEAVLRRNAFDVEDAEHK